MLRLSTIALLAATATQPALAQAKGDGFQGPRVFGDAALDQSLAAMNRETQELYRRDDILAGLVVPERADYATVSVTVRETARIAAAEAAEFTEVSGDAGLMHSLARMSDRVRDDNTLLFVEIARAAQAGTAPEPGSEFGPLIAGDLTLDAKITHVFDLVGDADPVGPGSGLVALNFTDETLDRAATAWTPPRTNL